MNFKPKSWSRDVGCAMFFVALLTGCGTQLEPEPIASTTPTDSSSPPGPAVEPVIAPASATGRINDTGVGNVGCYQAGSDTPLACSDASAAQLNPAQDGAVGRDADAATNSAIDGRLGFSYTKIGDIGQVLPADSSAWSCVKDNVTGLIWEVKTTDGGLRDFNKQYTNLDGTTPNQLGTPVPPATSNDPSAAQIAAATNTVGYVKAVNAQGLCGAANWRLPTASELVGIVDYGVGVPGPMIDTAWFGSTGTMASHWSGTQRPFGAQNFARVVGFFHGMTGSAPRDEVRGLVRLVRSS